MALYYQLSTQNVLTKYLSVSSITGGNSVNTSQLTSTVASLLTTSVIPPFVSTQGVFTSTVFASTVNTSVVSTLVLYASSIIGVTTGGGLATLPSTISTFSMYTSSLFVSTTTANLLSTQQLFTSSLLANSISSIGLNTGTLTGTNLFVSSATLSTFSTNNINFAGGFGYLTMPDIYPNTVYTSTVTASNLLVGWNSQISPIQFFGFGTYSNSVIAELSTGTTTQELVMFRGSNATDRIRFQTTGSLVFEPGVSARIWPTVPSNVTPAMVINTSSNVGIQTAAPAFPLDVAGTGRFLTVSTQQVFASSIQSFLMSTQAINLSSINGQSFGAPIQSTVIGLASVGYISTTQLTSTITGLASANYISTTQLTSTITGLASANYISTTQLTSTVAGIGPAFTGSTNSLSAGTIFVSSLRAVTLSSQQFFASSIFTNVETANSTLTSSLIVNGTGIVKANGTNSISLYGAGVDTFTLQTSCNAYATGIASMAFATNTSSYPLGRIYALDSAISGSPISQLVFQTVPVSANTFTSNYSYSGADQTFTVPTGVTSIQVTLWGAGGGGSGNTGIGGAGAFVQGVLSVQAGQIYKIVVGQGGQYLGTTTTYGGGGAGSSPGTGGSSGGGRSALQLLLTAQITAASGSGSAITFTTNVAHGLTTGQPVTISGLSPSGFNGNFAVASTPLTTSFTVVSSQTGSSTGTGTIYAEVVDAGGGGGGGWNSSAGPATFSGSGINGQAAGGNPGGTGGTQTAGGVQNGAILQGGAVPSGNNYAGGGGGGFYGGGAGTNNPGLNTGGGGGSSYTSFSGFSLVAGSNSPNSLNQAPATGSSLYVSGVAVGGSISGNGGSGYVVLQSIGGSITEAMRIGTNGYLGIATTTPTYPLDVAGNARLSNVYLGTNSTLITQQFYGMFGNYNNTVLAEISTGGGAQELLVFKGSSISDRVRVQTTGTFVVETGVSARLWSTNTAITSSNITPAFIVTTSSNVGIQTASPGATLDVAGTGRFLTLSSFQVFTSSIVAPYTFQPQYFSF